MTTQKQRDELAALMDFCYEHRANIHYPLHDVRVTSVGWVTSIPQFKESVTRPGGWSIDCSQMCYALLGAVGLHPPNQNGATGSMLDDLPHYSNPANAYIGALAVLGPYPGQHVCMVRHRDTTHGNPVVFSHGQESDPRLVNLSVEQANHRHPTTMLSIAHLG